MGIIRRIDELGRIVIPKEIRKQLKINANDPVNIECTGDNIVITNPNQTDRFGDWLTDYTLRTESIEAKNILVKYQELKK